MLHVLGCPPQLGACTHQPAAPHCLLPLQRQRGSNFTIGYRLHSTLPGSSAAAAPGARRMRTFKFGGVDTPYGQFRISVDYQPPSTVTILEQTTSPPPLPQIIADYVGSPTSSGRYGGGDGATPQRRGSGSVAAAAATPPLRHAASASLVAPPSPQQQASPLAAQQQKHQQAQPGSSPGSYTGSGGSGMPIRRSWSTSMRGASPQRLLSQPSGELPPSSPGPSARDMPYGSAPQTVSERVGVPCQGCCKRMPLQ